MVDLPAQRYTSEEVLEILDEAGHELGRIEIDKYNVVDFRMLPSIKEVISTNGPDSVTWECWTWILQCLLHLREITRTGFPQQGHLLALEELRFPVGDNPKSSPVCILCGEPDMALVQVQYNLENGDIWICSDPRLCQLRLVRQKATEGILGNG